MSKPAFQQYSLATNPVLEMLNEIRNYYGN